MSNEQPAGRFLSTNPQACRNYSGWALFTLLSLSSCDCSRRVGVQALEGQLMLVSYDEQGRELLAKDAVVDFGEVAYGERSKKTFSLRNQGQGWLSHFSFEKRHGDAVTLQTTDADDTDFYLSFEPRDSLSALDEFPFTLEFAPGHVTDARLTEVRRELKLQFQAEGASEEGSVVTLTVTGMGRGSMCALPQVIDFGKVPVGTQVRASHVFRNSLYLTAQAFVGQVAGADAPSFTQTAGPLGALNLPAGESESVEWLFVPTEARSYQAEVRMRAAGPCPEGTVLLRGEALDQALTWQPSTLDWGYVSPGATVSQNVVFFNAGSVPLTLSKFQTTSPSEFSIRPSAMGPGSSFVIPPGNVPTAFEVRCHPQNLGPKTAKLTFVTQLAKQPFGYVNLQCFGGGPNILVQPSSVLPMGTASFVKGEKQGLPLTRKLTVFNTGTKPKAGDLNGNLKLGQVTPTGIGQPPYFRLEPANDNTLEAEFVVSLDSAYDPASGLEATAGRNQVEVSVTLTPHTLGLKEARLIIYSNDSDQPAYTVQVNAQVQEVLPCRYAMTPSELNFGVVAPNSSKELQVQFTNLGNLPQEVCQFSNLQLSANSDSAYEWVEGKVDLLELKPGETKAYRVRVNTVGLSFSTLQSLVGAVEFDVSNPQQPHVQLPLSTTVGPVCLVVSPDSLNFGQVKKGCNSSTRTFSIYNTCNETVKLTDLRWMAQGGQPAGGPDCPGTQACPEFFTMTKPNLPPGGLELFPGGTPVTFQARYTPLDIGVDSGAVVIAAEQSGVAIAYVVNVSGASDGLGKMTDVFAQAAQPKADVLLTVDDSCSMFDKQVSLANNFSSFMSYAQSTNVDFHLAVVSTSDVDADPSLPGSQGKFVGDAQNPTVLTSQTPNLMDKFKAKVRLGIQGSIIEKGLATSTRALTPPLIFGHNAGFLRSDASLAVVVVTDAPDQSPEPVSQYVDRLLNIKGINRANLFTFNVIGPFMNAFLASCSYDSYSDDGRYASMVSKTSGVKDEICNANWASKLQAMGKTAFGSRQTFYLNATPDLSGGKTLEVQRNGVTLSSQAYDYDPIANAVSFYPTMAPGPGDTLSISYFVPCY